MGVSDIGGRVIPGTRGAPSGGRVVSVAPIRERPNEVAQELLFTGTASLAAASAVFIPIPNPLTSDGVFPAIPDQNRAVADSLLIFCPDMVGAVASYLRIRVSVNGQPVPAWGDVPIFPRAGVASVTFDTTIDLSPQAVVSFAGMNADAVNAHFVGIYLHGWMWPKDYVDR